MIGLFLNDIVSDPMFYIRGLVTARGPRDFEGLTPCGYLILITTHSLLPQTSKMDNNIDRYQFFFCDMPIEVSPKRNACHVSRMLPGGDLLYIYRRLYWRQSFQRNGTCFLIEHGGVPQRWRAFSSFSCKSTASVPPWTTGILCRAAYTSVCLWWS